MRAKGHVPWTSEALEARPGGLHDLGVIPLEPGTDVKVRVTRKDGKPATGVRVELRPLSEDQGGLGDRGRVLKLEAKNKKEGRFQLEGVPRAAWQLRVLRDKKRLHQERVVVRERASQSIRVKLK